MPVYSTEEIIELGAWIFEAETIESTNTTTEGRVEFRRFENVVLSSVDLPPFRYRHDPVKLRGVDNDYLLLEFMQAGHIRGAVEEHYVEKHPGVVHVIDMSARYECMFHKNIGRGFVIPHKLVGFDPSRHPRYVSVASSSDEGRLLQIAAEAFAARVEKPAARAEIEIFYNVLLGLIRTTILKEDDAQVDMDQKGRLAFIKTAIEKNLQEADLGPEVLAEKLGVSRASLYRMFKDDGGVARYVLDRRLQNAFAELVSLNAERGVVSRTAQRWGFRDPGTFNKQFRSRFGVAPRDCLLGDKRYARTHSGEVWHPVFDWMAKKQ